MVEVGILKKLASFGSAQLSDASGRTAAIGGFTVIGGGKSVKMCGIARTVAVPPGGNRSLHQLIPTVSPGEVIMVDGGGNLDRAVAGELIVLALRKRGAVGMVVHGAVRDVERLGKIAWPVFARGVSPLGPHKEAGGSVDLPLVFGDLAIKSGDVIFGDADGVVVIPADQVLLILSAAEQIVSREAAWMKDIRMGIGLPPIV
jgi:regulator of RNase E activity RraA